MIKFLSTSTLHKIALVGVGLAIGLSIAINYPALAVKDPKTVTAEPIPVEEVRAFTDVYDLIKREYVEPVSDKTLTTYAISGMLSNLDPHSVYLDKEATKELENSTKGEEFGGLGLEVSMENGLIKIISPVEDTPAYRAGIQPGDFIIKINDVNVKGGITLADAVKLMRGKAGTSITLTLVRAQEPQPIVVDLVRQIIKVQSVKSKLLEPGYLYTRITQFQEATTNSLVEHIIRDSSQPLKGIILDLRNNPGGLLYSAVGVSSVFLKPNTLVVSTQGRDNDANRMFYSQQEDLSRNGGNSLKGLPVWLRTVPVVVLVNGGSASASEIVAGALQDDKRALVAGTQTFGKGSVQTIFPLSKDTRVKLTTARYFTPAGRSIQAKGIVPDVVINETPDGFVAPTLREEDLNHHLANPTPAEEAPTPIKPKDSTDNKKQPQEGAAPPRRALEFASLKDYQLQQALSILKAVSVMKSQDAASGIDSKVKGKK